MPPCANKIRLLTVVGARPQFIKAAPVCRAITAWNAKNAQRKIEHIFVHTGQHYDAEMSDIFFEELALPKPDHHCNVGSGTHAEQTGKMLLALEKIFQKESPDCVLVYGDTNSTLAAALTAAKLNIPLAHVEAGLRSNNRQMPEEINRIVTDRLSQFLFCPTTLAQKYLTQESITQEVYVTGDVMTDQILFVARQQAQKLFQAPYLLLTLHREETCANAEILQQFLEQLNIIAKDFPIYFPAHPRVAKVVEKLNFKFEPHFKMIKPLGYLNAITAIQHAKALITDSGGMQKEAYLLKTPCITIRTETEWPETLTHGWNRLAPLLQHNFEARLSAALALDRESTPYAMPYGAGDAAEKIISVLAQTI